MAKERAAIHLLFTVIILLVIGRFVLVSSMVHPYADDWSYTVSGMREPLMERLATEYHRWNGRITSNILVLNNPMVLGLERGLPLYRTVPVVMILLTFAGAFALWRALFGARVPLWTGLLVCGCYVVVFLHVMPDPGEGIYWYTGSVTYQLPNALLLFLMAGWLRWQQRDHGVSRWALLGGNMLLTVFIALSNEVHMVLLLLAHVALFIGTRYTKGGWDPVLGAFAVLSFALALIMILAPGNEVRAGQYLERGQLFRSVLYAGLQTGRFIITWVFDPILILAAMAWVAFDRSHEPLSNFRYTFRLPLALSITAVFVVMFLPYWGTGILGQHRTVNVAFFLFFPAWLLSLSAWDRAVGRLRWPQLFKQPSSLGMVLVALFVMCQVWGTGARVNGDLWNDTLADYDRGIRSRYAVIMSAVSRGDSTVQIPAVRPMPTSIRITDEGPDPDHWGNRALARYMGSDALDIVIGGSNVDQ